MSPEMRPKSYGTFEKQAPGNRTLWKTFAKITNSALCQIYGLGIVFLCQSRDIIGNLSKYGVTDAPKLGVNLWNSIHHQMRKLLEKRFKSSNEKQLLQILRVRMIMLVYLKLSLNSIKSSFFF